ncbi:Hydroquinone glucosyltransferase [Camellia lanceoleosa]|uniref:Hydroquinone glucosyltransferase n=1 Tax=Camellia lanceoleosa TaxID=1840588 RepID=A0ACC0IM87_9ERIC|nr:Hydroquinone glucosyltransferase [Camellia lanceoleosa]
MTLSLSFLRDTFASLTTTTRLVALIVDPFSIDGVNVAKKFGVLQYLFFPSLAMSLQFFFHLPKLDEMVTCEYRDLLELIKLPGSVPVHGRDLTDSVQGRSNDAYKGFLANIKQFVSVEGIILNSFMELKDDTIKDLWVEKPGKPPIYPIGLLIQTGSSDASKERSKCLQWLDDQPSGSVVFVSFESGGTLSHD